MTVDVTALSISVTSSGIKEASQALGGLSKSAGNAATRIEKLTEALRKLQTSSTVITQTMGSTAALTAALTALNNSLVILNQRTAQAETSQRRHNESMREAHGLARGLTGSLGALWLSYGAFAGMATGLAIGASLKGIVTVGKDVEHTLEGIRVRGQETTATVNKMREAIFSLGTGVYGPQQVSEAFETLVLAGLNAEQALVSVNAAMNLAVIGGTTIEKAAMTLVSVGTAVGYTAEGFDRVGDVIAKTAALSMSSVATLSEAFKSASSVNRLYGVSLEDIGTGLGVLSNLGIQGSAAGTAQKNFYKELASGSEKVTKTLKDMGLTISDLKNSSGKFLPLIEVVEKLSNGTKKLKLDQQDLAAANLTNERGLRMYTQVMGEWNTVTANGSNALIDFQKAVTNSHGFAAIGAVAMALTAKSQIDSMLNSLKTSFAETFTEMQPEIIAFTGQMKEIFKSQEFKDGIKALAQGFANLALALANNLPLITATVVAFTAFKTVMAIGTVLKAMAVGIAAIGPAFAAATTGALTFTAALGPIAILLGIVTAAVILYNNAQADSNKHTKNAIDYSAGYLSGLEDEANRLAKVNAQLSTKKTLSEATAEIARAEARDKMNELNKKAVTEAKDNLENGTKWTGYTRLAQVKALAEAEAKYHEENRIAIEQENRIKEYNLRIDEKVKANAKANRITDGGDDELSGRPDKAKINDIYGSAMIKQMATIKSAKKDMQDFEERQNTIFKMGEIGKLQFLENVQEKQIEMFIKAQDARREQMKIAQSKGSQSDVARVGGDMDQARQDFDNKTAQNRLDKEAAVQKAVEDYTKLRIIQLEEEHSYAAATMLKWETDSKAAYKAAEADAKAYGDVFPVLWDRVEQLGATQEAAMKNAFNREDVREFNIAAEATRNAMKGIQTASEGNGIAAMFEAAQKASAKYAADLPELRKQMGKLTDPEDINEAQAQLTRLAETQRKLWEGVGESISKSLESAFGRGGKAVGDLAQIAMNYNNLENKTGAARVKAFGDAAGAAKGFFKEGSSGYKTMEKAEKAFRAVEFAGQAQSVALTIASSAKRIAAMIPEFLVAWGKLGPWGYVAGAVALAAILGKSGGGSAPPGAEQRQETQGKGSVLGDKDAKSDSISNSLAIMEKNSGLGLAQGNSMIGHLRAMVDGMRSLAQMVVRTSGITGDLTSSRNTGMTGIADNKILSLNKTDAKWTNKVFGGSVSNTDTGFTMNKSSLGDAVANGVSASQYADNKRDGGWFRKDKYSTETAGLGGDANAQFSKLIANMSGALTEGAKTLGIGGDAFTAKLNSFVVDVGKISLKGMSGAEIQEALEAVFSKLGDDMARFAIGGLDKFQAVGEGYLETVVRIVNDLTQVKDVFAILGKTFEFTGIKAVEVSQGLIQAAGGLENLTSGTRFFVENFLTEAERMGPITASVTNRLKELNVSEITSIDLFKKKVQSLDLANAADQLLYANLLELAPAFKEASDYATQLAEGTVQLTKAQQTALDIANKQRELDIRLMEAQGNSLGAIAARRADELAGLRKLAPQLAITQQAIYDAEDATAALNKTLAANTAKRALELRIMDASGNVAGSLARKREDEVEAMKKTNPELVSMLKTFYDVEDAAKAVTAAQDKLAKIQSSSASLDIRMAEAQGNTVKSLGLKRKEEMKAMNDVSPALGNYLQLIYDTEDANVKNTDVTEKLTKAKDNLTDAYQRESSGLQSVIDKFTAFGASLKKFKQELLGGDMSTLSPEQKYLNSKANFSETSARAASGDETALGELQNVAQEFLNASRGYNASTELYAADFNLVQAALDQGINSAAMQASNAQAQLAIMNAQYTSLVEIKDGVLSYGAALAEYLLAKAKGGVVAGDTSGQGDALGDPNYIQWYVDKEAREAKEAKEAEAKAAVEKTMKDLLAEIALLNANTLAAIGQQGAIAEQNVMKLDDVVSAVNVVARKIAAIELQGA